MDSNKNGASENLDLLNSPEMGETPSAEQDLFNAIMKEGDSNGVQEQEQGQEKAQEVTSSPSSTTLNGEAQVTTPPLLSAKLGDKTFDVPEDATTIVKIDGKDVEVSFKELKRNHQGKVPWEKHYGDLKRDRAKFEDDVKTLDTWFTKVLDLVKTDPKQALLEIVGRSGRSPADFPELFQDELEGLDENQKQIILKSKDIEHREKKMAADKAARDKEAQEQKSKQDVANYLVGRQKELGISDSEIESAYKLLQNVLAEDTEGKLKLDQKTPFELADLMISHILVNERPNAQITSTIKELFPSASITPSDVDYIKTLISAEKIRNPNLGKEDIAEIVKAVYSSSEEEEPEPIEEDRPKPSKQATPFKEPIKERAKKSATSPKALSKKDTEARDDDPVTFEDLLSPYR